MDKVMRKYTYIYSLKYEIAHTPAISTSALEINFVHSILNCSGKKEVEHYRPGGLQLM